MDPMPRPRKPNVVREKTRHGTVVWYYRKGQGPRTRLPGPYGSPEWLAAYDAASRGQAPEPATQAKAHTLAWLCERYYQSAPFLALRASTQAVRRGILSKVCKTGGKSHVQAITRAAVRAGYDARGKTPHAAQNYLKTLSRLFDWAVEAGYMKENPAKGIKRTIIRTEGHEPWTVEEVVQFVDHHGKDSMAYLALVLMLTTGLRRGDACRVGRQHIRDNVIEWRAEKTGTRIHLPVLPILQDAMDRHPLGLTLLTTSRGHGFKSAAAFGGWFGKMAREAGVMKNCHGLRKLSASIMAEGGASNRILQASYGWNTNAMVDLYTRKAQAQVLARAGSDILAKHPLMVNIKGE